MDPIRLVPRNSLEVALGQAQIGEISMPDFLRVLVVTDLFILSVKEVSTVWNEMKMIGVTGGSGRFREWQQNQRGIG